MYIPEMVEYVEMIQQFLKYAGDEIQKKNFHSSKKAVNVNNVNIEGILISDEFAHGKNKETDAKYFIGYQNDKKQTMIHHTPTNEWISQSKSKKPDTCPCNQE